MPGMEVRLPMVIEEHRDHDPVEAADRRHPPIMRLQPDAIRARISVCATVVAGAHSDYPKGVKQDTAPTAKARRRADLALVGSYYEARLAELLERVREGFARYDAGELNAFDLDDLIHRYKRATRELWKFCGDVTGSGAGFIARTLRRCSRAANPSIGGSKGTRHGMASDPRWLRLKVSLVSGRGEAFEPAPGRVMIAAPEHTLAELAEAIDLGFARWDHSHLHLFRLPDGRELMSGEELASGIRLDAWSAVRYTFREGLILRVDGAIDPDRDRVLDALGATKYGGGCRGPSPQNRRAPE
jgi:hypothetical protein